MSKEIKKRLLFPIIGGFLIVMILLLVLVMIHPYIRGNTDNTVMENFPLAWVLYWPTLFTGDNQIAMLICDVLAYSVFTYVILELHSRAKWR